MSVYAFSEKEERYGFTPVSNYTVINRAREGVARAISDEVAGLIGLSDNEMAHVLGMTPRNLHRILPDKVFGKDASERLILFRNVLMHALDIFGGNKKIVLQWLRTPISELQDQSPLEMLDTLTGFGLVDDVLGRLDYGLPA